MKKRLKLPVGIDGFEKIRRNLQQNRWEKFRKPLKKREKQQK